jgi:hypothetical protein
VLKTYVTYGTRRNLFEILARTLKVNAMSKQAEFAVILKMNADLGPDELTRLSYLCHTQHLASGEVLFQKGDPGDLCSECAAARSASRPGLPMAAG